MYVAPDFAAISAWLAEKQRVPMIVVVGDEEVANNNVALRDRRKRERSVVSKEQFLQQLQDKITKERI